MTDEKTKISLTNFNDLTEADFEVGAFYVKQNDPSRFYRFLGFNECGDEKYACFRYRATRPYKSSEEKYWANWRESLGREFGSMQQRGEVRDGLRYYRGMIPVNECHKCDEGK